MRCEAYYVPVVSIRLFSLQTYFQENNDKGHCDRQARKTVLTLPDGTSLTFPYNSGNNLPLMLTTNPLQAGLTAHDIPTVRSMLLSVADQTNQNLTTAQRELLLWHWRFGHANLKWCQTLLRNDIVPVKNKGVASCPKPKCCACLPKQRRRTPKTGTTIANPTKQMQIRRDCNRWPGSKVSIDQYISGLPGRLPHTKGKEKPNKKYSGGTIFFDHATSYIFYNIKSRWDPAKL